MLFQRHTEQFSVEYFLSNWSCLLWSYLRELSWLVSLISPNFPFPVFLKLFFLTTVCWISATWCFSWIKIIGIAFEPLLVVQTACIICCGEKLTIFKHGNMRRRLSSLFEMYARKAWSLCYTALNNCYGIELSGASLLPVLENLIACLLIYSSMFGGSYFPQVAQLAFTFFIENFKNRKGVSFYWISFLKETSLTVQPLRCSKCSVLTILISQCLSTIRNPFAILPIEKLKRQNEG